MTIQLKAYSFPKIRKFNPTDILTKVHYNEEYRRSSQVTGLITYGSIDAIQGTGGFGWAISDLIEFPYIYIERPTFSFGNDGSYSGNNHTLTDGLYLPDTNPHTSGDNNYGKTLPQALQDFIDAGDVSTWQPAVFIPRVVHWWMEDTFYYGCHILVIQVNTNCTEVNKKTRLNYRFEGTGIIKTVEPEE